MKILGVFLVALVISGAHSAHNPFGWVRNILRNAGNTRRLQTCSETVACPEDKLCLTTDNGMVCYPKEKLPCTAATEETVCTNNTACYVPTGADEGLCGGCGNDTQCTMEPNTHCRLGRSGEVGICVECLETADCAATEFCMRANRPIMRFFRNRSSNTCTERQETGRCFSNEECLSGQCSRFRCIPPPP